MFGKYEEREMTGNGNYIYLLNFIWKNREITSGELIFGEFEQFGTTVQQPEPEINPVKFLGPYHNP